MRKLLFLLPLLPSLLLADVSAEKLAEIRQQALEQAVIFHKGKNPSTSQLLQTAREFEDYLLNQNPAKATTLSKKAKTFKKSVAPARVSNFNGLFVGINLQNKSTTAKVSGDVRNSNTTYRATFDGIGQSNYMGDIAIDYGFSITDKALLLVGGNYGVNNNEILDFHGAWYRGGFPVQDSLYGEIKVEEKHHFSLYVTPGYELSENVLGYAKLAYHQSKFETSNTLNFTNGKETVHGYGVGFGMRSQVTDNLFAEVGIQRVMYSTDSITSRELGTGSTIGTVGLAYNFDNKGKVLFDNKAVDFKGLNIGFTGELKSTLSELTVGRTTSSNDNLSSQGASFDSAGRQNIVSSITLDYVYPVAHRTFIMVGGTYSLENNETLKLSESLGNSAKVEEEDHYSIFVSPAYQLSNNSLGFMKFAYHSAKLNLTNPLSNNALGTALPSYSEDIRGFGIGFGLRSEVYKNIYTDIEIQKVMYGSESISQYADSAIDVDSTIANVGISYKF